MNTNKEEEDWIQSIALVSGRVKPEATFGFIPNPIKIVGKAVKKVSKTIHSGLKSIPVAGDTMAAIYQVGGGPATLGLGGAAINLVAGVAAGDNVNKTGLNELRKSVSAYNDLVPLIAMIPGVGPALTGAISSADAISKGKPIEQVAVTAARSSLPAGVPQAAFDAGYAITQGKVPSVSGLGLNNVQAEQFRKGLEAGKLFADGKGGGPVPGMAGMNEIKYNTARSMLPSSARTALDKGFAVGLAQKLQAAHARIAPTLKPFLALQGKKEVEANPVLKVGMMNLIGKPEVQKGFQTGIGFSLFQAVPAAAKSVRDSLVGDQKKGFDLAITTRIGELTSSVPSKLPAKQKIGTYVAEGLRTLPQANKVPLLKVLGNDKEIQTGIIKVAKKEGFFAWLKSLFGIKS